MQIEASVRFYLCHVRMVKIKKKKKAEKSADDDVGKHEPSFTVGNIIK